MALHQCPAENCSVHAKSSFGLQRHWCAKHKQRLGDLYKYTLIAPAQCLRSTSAAADASTSRHDHSIHDTGAIEAPHMHAIEQTVCSVAIDHIDEMKYRFFDGESTVNRAKQLAIHTLHEIKPLLVNAIRPHIKNGVDLEALISPITNALDVINTRKKEERFRRNLEAEVMPPLKVHPRVLGSRTHGTSATSSRHAWRKQKVVDEAIIYETRIEEMLERELALDPELLQDILESEKHWAQVNRTRSADTRHGARRFSDVCDGQV